MKGHIHSLQSFGTVDGPGVRYVVFLQGCPMRCLYCHNPDTWKLEDGNATDSDHILAEISKYAGFLRMAGGLTITGGEPLVQADFVHDIFERAKNELHLHTALDTQGFLAGNLPDEWFDCVDLVLLDIKEMNPETHQRLTGKPLQPTLDFAQRLARMGKPVWLRYVLVPGLTDSDKDLQALADFIRPLKNIERVEVLPFHNMAIHKWDDLKIPYTLRDTPSPTTDQVEHANSILQSALQ